MNRVEFQALTRTRLREARILLKSGEPSGAYYLGGYAVECALKACIAKKTKRHDFLTLSAVQKAHTHTLIDLIRAAGLEASLKGERRNAGFSINWNIVRDWTVDSRYDARGRKEAADLISAITARKHGVLTWLRKHW